MFAKPELVKLTVQDGGDTEQEDNRTFPISTAAGR